MSIDNLDKAAILVEALPYIQKYRDKIVVVKYGGNAMVNEELKTDVMRDVVLLSLIGVKVVLVHGGGPDISAMLKRIGKETVFCDGLRVTDAETAEIAQMVLCGKVNKDLVKRLGTIGGRAVGLSGMDAGLLGARKLDPRLGFVGDVTEVDVGIIRDLLDRNYIPVVSTMGCDAEGNVYNVNADTAAARIAAELQAENLLLLTDIRGVLADPADPDTLYRQLSIAEAQRLIKRGVISGGMIPKTDCCIDALRRGVRKVIMLDGRISHAVLVEILSDEGVGTMIRSE